VHQVGNWLRLYYDTRSSNHQDSLATLRRGSRNEMRQPTIRHVRRLETGSNINLCECRKFLVRHFVHPWSEISSTFFDNGKVDTFRSARIFRSEHVSILNVPLRGPCLLIICHSGLACLFLCFVLKLRHCVRDAQIPGHLIFMVAPNINGTLVWNFLHTVLLAPRFLENLWTPALRYYDYYLCLIVAVSFGRVFVCNLYVRCCTSPVVSHFNHAVSSVTAFLGTRFSFSWPISAVKTRRFNVSSLNLILPLLYSAHILLCTSLTL